MSLERSLKEVLKKKVSELTEEDKEILRKWLLEHRSRRSIAVDLRYGSKRVPVYASTWYAHQGKRYDIPGVDTPEALPHLEKLGYHPRTRKKKKQKQVKTESVPTAVKPEKETKLNYDLIYRELKDEVWIDLRDLEERATKRIREALEKHEDLNKLVENAERLIARLYKELKENPPKNPIERSALIKTIITFCLIRKYAKQMLEHESAPGKREEKIEPFTYKWYSIIKEIYEGREEFHIKNLLNTLSNTIYYLDLIRVFYPEEYPRIIEYLKKHAETLVARSENAIKYHEPMIYDHFLEKELETLDEIPRAFLKKFFLDTAKRVGATNIDSVIKRLIEESRTEWLEHLYNPIYKADDIFNDVVDTLMLLAYSKYGFEKRLRRARTKLLNEILDKLGKALGVDEDYIKILKDEYKKSFRRASYHYEDVKKVATDVGNLLVLNAYLDRIVPVIKDIMNAKFFERSNYDVLEQIVKTALTWNVIYEIMELIRNAKVYENLDKGKLYVEDLLSTGYKPFGKLIQVNDHTVIDRDGKIDYIIENLGNKLKISIKDNELGKVIAEEEYEPRHLFMDITDSIGDSILRHIVGVANYYLKDKNYYKLLRFGNKWSWVRVDNDKLVILSPEYNIYRYNEPNDLRKLINDLKRLRVLEHDQAMIINAFKEKAREIGYEYPSAPIDAVEYIAKKDNVAIVKNGKYWLVIGENPIISSPDLEFLAEEIKKKIKEAYTPIIENIDKITELFNKLGINLGIEEEVKTQRELSEIADKIFGEHNYKIETKNDIPIAVSEDRVKGIILGSIENVKKHFKLDKIEEAEPVIHLTPSTNIDDALKLLKEDIEWYEKIAKEGDKHAKQRLKQLQRTYHILEEIHTKYHDRPPIDAVYKYIVEQYGFIPVVQKYILPEDFYYLYRRIHKLYGKPEKIYLGWREGIEFPLIILEYPKFSLAVAPRVRQT